MVWNDGKLVSIDQEGYYWIRYGNHLDMRELVLLSQGNIWIHGDDRSYDGVVDFLGSEHFEWMGPIPEPDRTLADTEPVRKEYSVLDIYENGG